MSVFSARDYKACLAEFVAQHQRRGLLTEMAKAIGCTHSYLSQVFNGKPDLTPDQGLAAAEFMSLDEAASDYFLALLFHDRASTPALRSHFQAKLKELKRTHLEVTARMKKSADTRLSLADQQQYYATTRSTEIHLLTACTAYQTAESLAIKLGLTLSQVQRELDSLVMKGLVAVKGRSYQHSGKNLHLNAKSPFNRINHLNWRLKAVEKCDDSESIHYTSSFAISREDWPRLKESLLKFIEDQRAQIGASGADDAFVFCCDLFPVA